MLRRDFLKLSGIVPFLGSLFVRERVEASNGHPMPSEKDKACAQLMGYSNIATTSNVFVQYEGFWFFADRDVIKYCPISDLRWDNWETINMDCHFHVFDFWKLEEGRLFWCGEREMWEITNTKPVLVEYRSFWDGERWIGEDS